MHAFPCSLFVGHGGYSRGPDELVNKCLLQDVDGGGYRVHHLVIEFLKIKTKADGVGGKSYLEAGTVPRETRRGEGLRRPGAGAGNQGLFVLGALWRSVEKLTGDLGLEV